MGSEHGFRMGTSGSSGGLLEPNVHSTVSRKLHINNIHSLTKLTVTGPTFRLSRQLYHRGTVWYAVWGVQC